MYSIKKCKYEMCLSLVTLLTWLCRIYCFINLRRKIKKIVSKFLLFIRITVQYYSSQGLVNGLQEIDKLKSQVQDVHVPLEVFE